jgi:hypothetical protein
VGGVEGMSRKSSERYPVVAVPVRNEAERLPRLLEALAKQSWIAAADCPLPVVLVLNNCTDESAAILASLDTPFLRLDVVEVQFAAHCAHVGSARRLAMDRAFVTAGRNGLLLTTDADAVPRYNWVEANLRAVAEGADLVGGQIVGDPGEERLLGPGFNRRASRQLRYNRLVDQLRAFIEPLPYDPWPRHTDHTGASLAVKSEVYAKLDGIPMLPCREDVAFVEKARSEGFRLRHPLDVLVHVSARLDGRATGGMADCIKGWVTAEQFGLPHLVEDPATVLRRNSRGPSDAILIPPEQDATSSNEAGGSRLTKPEIDIEIAIARLERMIAVNGMR